jgi:hypothetical protein
MNTKNEPIVRQPVDESRVAALAETIKQRHQEWLLDEALAETFPASDPVSASAFN